MLFTCRKYAPCMEYVGIFSSTINHLYIPLLFKKQSDNSSGAPNVASKPSISIAFVGGAQHRIRCAAVFGAGRQREDQSCPVVDLKIETLWKQEGITPPPPKMGRTNVL